MAKYRTLSKSFINNTIVEAGEIVDYDGKAGSNLELVEDVKPKAEAKGKTPKANVDAAADDLV
jgi:hypothetical protein